MARTRGLDGLTPDELRASRQSFWDQEFTELLVRRLPATAKVLLDIGCGLGAAARALLPTLPSTRYIGLDADPVRLDEAARNVRTEAYAGRAAFLAAQAEQVPLPDGAVDTALLMATLQHVRDPLSVMGEVHRVLSPEGVLVAVEPDNLAAHVTFDGRLDAASAAHRVLCEEVREDRRPADLAIGPALARLAECASFEVREFFPYLLGRARRQAAGEFLVGLRQQVETVSASLPASSPARKRCLEEFDRVEASLGGGTMGWGCVAVPVYVCVARRG